MQAAAVDLAAGVAVPQAAEESTPLLRNFSSCWASTNAQLMFLMFNNAAQILRLVTANSQWCQGCNAAISTRMQPQLGIITDIYYSRGWRSSGSAPAVSNKAARTWRHDNQPACKMQQL
jgi:hypothetical protein